MSQVPINVMSIEEFRRYCITNDTRIEGGLTKGDTLKDDLGGETNHGITVGKAREYEKELRTKFNWDGTMINLSKAMAFFIYEEDFWNGMSLDRVSDYSRRLANAMFRWGLKSGQSRPTKTLQTILNVMNNKEAYWKDLVVDGQLGTRTFLALDAFIAKRGLNQAKSVVFCLMQSAMESHMVNISVAREDNETFTWGWVTRCINERTQYISEYGVPEL